jgi:hypothetical protein
MYEEIEIDNIQITYLNLIVVSGRVPDLFKQFLFKL